VLFFVCSQTPTPGGGGKPKGGAAVSIHYSKDLDNRLAAAEGHIAAIRRMMEENRECEDILMQLSAAESAIDKVAKIILKEHLNHCVKESIERGETESLEKFNRILDKYL
jgi:DNA-binding FrmR family transcriptional regulator